MEPAKSVVILPCLQDVEASRSWSWAALLVCMATEQCGMVMVGNEQIQVQCDLPGAPNFRVDDLWWLNGGDTVLEDGGKKERKQEKRLKYGIEWDEILNRMNKTVDYFICNMCPLFFSESVMCEPFLVAEFHLWYSRTGTWRMRCLEKSGTFPVWVFFLGHELYQET